MIRLNRLPSVSTAMYKQVMVVTHPLGFAWSLCDKQQAQMPYSSIPILLTNFPYSQTLDKFELKTLVYFTFKSNSTGVQLG